MLWLIYYCTSFKQKGRETGSSSLSCSGYDAVFLCDGHAQLRSMAPSLPCRHAPDREQTS